MRIRDALERDLPAIVGIYNAAIPSRMATADLNPVSVASRLDWYRNHHPMSRPVWVMETNGKIIGWLSFQSFYGRPAYHATAEISIYIAPPYQGQGIGKKLLSEAINRSQGLGLKTLVAFIFAHNQPSLKLFQTYGFQQWGYLPQVAELDGIERDLVILGFQLC